MIEYNSIIFKGSFNFGLYNLGTFVFFLIVVFLARGASRLCVFSFVPPFISLSASFNCFSFCTSIVLCSFICLSWPLFKKMNWLWVWCNPYPPSPSPVLRAPRVHFVTINTWPYKYHLACVLSSLLISKSAPPPPPPRRRRPHFIPSGTIAANMTVFLMSLWSDGPMNGAGRFEDWQCSTHIIILPPVMHAIYLDSSPQCWLF